MKKTLLYTSIVILYFLTPVLLIGITGTMVSLKYEVDQGYYFIETNKNLTKEQKENEFRKIDKKRKWLKTQYYLLIAGSIFTTTIATGLIIKRKKIINGEKSST